MRISGYRAGGPRGAGPVLEITSPANPRIKQLVALRRRRDRDRAGATLVEGRAEIELALAAGVRLRALYHCPELGAAGAGRLADKAAGAGRLADGAAGAGRLGDVAAGRLADEAAALGAEVFLVSRPAFEKISYREGPDGWLAVAPAIDASLGHLRLGTDPLVLACAGLEKPGNLGAILRTADAAGVNAVIAADPVTDWGNPNVVRASKGAVFAIPVASAGSAEIFAWTEGNGLRIVAASPQARVAYTEADLTGPVVIAVGAEQSGLPARWLDVADVLVRIPMFGRADSLNVSAAAAVLVYEAVRQRQVPDLDAVPPVR